MKLTLRRYSFILFFQFAFLIADLFFNSYAMLLTKNFEVTVVMFVAQDFLIIFEYILFTFTVHSTCVYQVGASHVILRDSKFFLLTILTYFLLSATQHFWIVYNTVYDPQANWPMTLTVLAFVQRTVSFVYYYAYKRQALHMSDPRYYEENIDWIAEQLSDK